MINISALDPARLQELIDRQDIYDLLMRFSRGVDRGDYDLARSVYHHDALDHHTGFDGTATEFMDWFRGASAGLGAVHHMLGNFMVEIRGDRAVSEVYGILTMRGEDVNNARFNMTTGFRYVDRLERRAGVWGITERWVVRDWQRSDMGALMPKEALGPDGKRGRDDPLYEALAYLD